MAKTTNPRKLPPKVQTSTDRMIDSLLEEWKRSMLTYWVLGLLLERSMYGLEIKREIEASTQGRMKLGASTVYQLLRRLEARKLLTSRWERTEQGPPRGYYELTASGEELVYRYAQEVLSPNSPIAAALSLLTAKVFHRVLSSEEPRSTERPTSKDSPTSTTD